MAKVYSIMETTRPCGCKGIRTCLICEKEYDIPSSDLAKRLREKEIFVYCPYCDKAWPGWSQDSYKEHPYHNGNGINFPGVYIQLNFLTANESKSLTNDLDALPWETSQSGRRKQNYGPKCNFKKKRLRLGSFGGFPRSTKFVQDKFRQVSAMHDFQTIEQCTLEYNPDRGASIDPHIDDCWIWGERIVTVNVLGDSVLTMTPFKGSIEKYNLDCVYESRSCMSEANDIVVRLPMPENSLMILYGSARYDWEHCVLREDVTTRRLCIAYREFTPPYLPSGKYGEETAEIFEKALTFW